MHMSGKKRIWLAVVGLAAWAVIPVGAVVVKKDKIELEVERVGYQRGEKVEIKTRTEGEGNVALTLTPSTGEKEAGFLVDRFAAGTEHASSLDTWLVRPGLSRLEATLMDKSNKIVGVGSVEIGIQPEPVPHLGQGIFGFGTGADPEVYFREWAAMGCDHAFFHHNVSTSKETFRSYLDQGYKHGILVAPILNTYVAPLWNEDLTQALPKDQLKAEEWGQLLKPDNTIDLSPWGYPYACMRAPHAREAMAKFARMVLDQGKGMPGFQILSLDDEYGVQLDWAGKGMACYCQYCSAYFNEKTGLEPPVPEYAAPGFVAKDDDPYLLWVKTIGKAGGYEGASLEFHNSELKKVIQEADPKLTVTQMPGGFSGELDAVVTEVYLYNMRTPELATAWTMDLQYALLRGKERPIWPLLGWYEPSATPPAFVDFAPAELELITKICLAKGAHSIDIAPYQMMNDKTMQAKYAALAQEMKAYGPMLLNLHREPMPVAVLLSQTTEAYQTVLRWEEAKKLWEKSKKWFEEPWEHQQSLQLAYAALMRAHIPVEVVTEDALADGKLSNYKALVLVDHEYSTEGLEARLRDYQKAGGLILADKSSVVKPEGAIEIPFDFSVWSGMISLGLRNTDPEVASIVRDRQINLIEEGLVAMRRAVADKLVRPVTFSSDKVVYSLSRNGDSQYLFLLNSDLRLAQKTHVSLATSSEFVYDVLKSQAVVLGKEGPKVGFDTEVPAAGWKVFLISPMQITQLRIDAEQKERQIHLKVAVLGAAGVRVSGAHPLKVVLRDPKKRETPYSGYLGTNEGVTEMTFTLARNELGGRWQIEATDLASGIEAVQTLDVK